MMLGCVKFVGSCDVRMCESCRKDYKSEEETKMKGETVRRRKSISRKAE